MKKLFISVVVLLFAVLTLTSSVNATSIIPSYVLDYSNPSSGSWNDLSPSFWNVNIQGRTCNFLYTAYSSPTNWQSWTCDYYSCSFTTEDYPSYPRASFVTFEEYLKGYASGQWTVFAVKLTTKTTIKDIWQNVRFEMWMYYQLNGGAWQFMNYWSVDTNRYTMSAPNCRIYFARQYYSNGYHTIVAYQWLNCLGQTSGAHDFGALSFSSPSVEQVFWQADSTAYRASAFGHRYNEQLVY